MQRALKKQPVNPSLPLGTPTSMRVCMYTTEMWLLTHIRSHVHVDISRVPGAMRADAHRETWCG